MVIAVDFDGTIVEHCYPSIGKELPFAIETLLKLKEEGIVLYCGLFAKGSILMRLLSFAECVGWSFTLLTEIIQRRNKCTIIISHAS